MQMFDDTLQADVGFSISFISALNADVWFTLSKQMLAFSKITPLGHMLFLDAYNLLCTSPISRVEFHRFYKMLN